jgi:hypothetical protein
MIYHNSLEVSRFRLVPDSCEDVQDSSPEVSCTLLGLLSASFVSSSTLCGWLEHSAPSFSSDCAVVHLGTIDVACEPHSGECGDMSLEVALAVLGVLHAAASCMDSRVEWLEL